MSTASGHITVVALTMFLAAVAFLDLATHRIPNRLTVPATVLAFAIHYLTAGAAGALDSAQGLGIGLAAFLPLFLAGGTGAGDVKAMAAVGAFLGPTGVFFAVLWTMIAGMVGALVVLVAAGGPGAIRELLRRWMFRAYVLCTTGHAAHVLPPEGDPGTRRFPYGLAVAAGTIVSLIWGAYRG